MQVAMRLRRCSVGHRICYLRVVVSNASLAQVRAILFCLQGFLLRLFAGLLDCLLHRHARQVEMNQVMQAVRYCVLLSFMSDACLEATGNDEGDLGYAKHQCAGECRHKRASVKMITIFIVVILAVLSFHIPITGRCLAVTDLFLYSWGVLVHMPGAFYMGLVHCTQALRVRGA